MKAESLVITKSRDFGWNREHQESNDKSLTGPITGSEVCGDTRALGPRNEILCLKARLYDCEQQQ